MIHSAVHISVHTLDTLVESCSRLCGISFLATENTPLSALSMVHCSALKNSAEKMCIGYEFHSSKVLNSMHRVKLVAIALLWLLLTPTE